MKHITSILKMTSIVVCGCIFGIGIMLAYRTIAISAVPGAHPSAATTTTPVGEPEWLIIPSIGVDAPIKPVGIAADGDLGVPTDAIHVAWYKDGPRPGAPGTAVIDGHLDTKFAPQAVFYNLNELSPGDEVDVKTMDGQTVKFKVTAVKEYPYDASTTGIFASTGAAPELNLITCAGDWMPAKKLYNQRLVVFTEQVD